MGRLKALDLAERRRIVLRMAESGMTYAEIISATGFSRAAVCRHLAAARAGQIAPAPVNVDLVGEMFSNGVPPDEIAKRCGISRSYVKSLLSRLGLLRSQFIDVPEWVPLSLRADYVDFAMDFDEHYAARQVRRLKAEAA